MAHEPTLERSLDIGVYGARGVPSTYGGYETFLTTLLPELVERGHSVTVYCRDGESDDEYYRGVRRVVLPAIDTKQLSTLTHGFNAARAARRAGHDVILTVNPANAPFCAWNRLGGQRVLLNTDGQEWLRGKWGRAGRAWFRSAARLAGRCSTGLIADGTAMGAIYRDEFAAPSSVIPYCSPNEPFETDRTVPAAFGVEASEYVVIAARLNPENNVDTVAEAYHRSDLSLPLLVLGEANYDSPVAHRLRQLAAVDDRIRLGGHVADRDQFLNLLSNARAYVHAHSVGGTNPSLIEAMRVGSLVVALDTGFNREALDDTGVYFDVDGPGMDLASALRSVVSLTSDASASLRQQAQQRIEDWYSVDAVVSAYEAVLLASIDHTGRGLVVDTPWSTGIAPRGRSVAHEPVD